MAKSSNTDTTASGLKAPPHFFLHHLTASRAELPDIITGQRCYTFFDALAIPIPHDLRFSFTTDGFETWWSMWKTHAFRRALGPLLRQLDAEYDIPADQASTEGTSSGTEETSEGDSSSGNSERSTTHSQTASPAPAFEKRLITDPSASQAPARSGSRTKRRCVKRARKNPQASSSSQEVSNVIIFLIVLHVIPPSFESANRFLLQATGTASGDVEEAPRPSATLDLATSTTAAAQAADPPESTEKPIVTAPAVPPSLGEGCDLSSLLTFDPESVEPASSKASGEPNLSTVRGPLQRLRDLLSTSTDTLIENSEEAQGTFEDIRPHLPMTLQVELWPAVTLSAFKSRVQAARQRVTLRHSQLPLRADIAEKCRRLNEKKAVLDAKTNTSATHAELESLRKELENLEEKVRMTKQLIQDKEALVARSQDEARGLTADLRTDLAEIRTYSW
ncbi:hypothetical protein QYE76_068123 [Lolium multiflorum]|uniref:Uncharacterized protein n=1 Tax=Lolium multiflorum TaxID=4521 RepID=A0AAD8SEU9_LOLMU|nr:hypothetical protein QYE76_068123 [Lolium multiflorum]